MFINIFNKRSEGENTHKSKQENSKTWSSVKLQQLLITDSDQQAGTRSLRVNPRVDSPVHSVDSAQQKSNRVKFGALKRTGYYNPVINAGEMFVTEIQSRETDLIQCEVGVQNGVESQTEWDDPTRYKQRETLIRDQLVGALTVLSREETLDSSGHASQSQKRTRDTWRAF